MALNDDDSSFVRVEPEEEDWLISEVFRTPAFWVLMFVRCESGAVETAVTFYI